MLRFPNPGSTTSNFVGVYNAAFEKLADQVVNLDDIVSVTVEANLATSSGYMGSEAISRSTRPDRSRDPLYNQIKMYAELFRALGWLHRTQKSALNFTFTLLGHQIVAAGQNYFPLLGETVLGLSHPSPVLNKQGDHDLRPFAFLLKMMLACDNALSRDEMIVGPLSATSDRSSDAVPRMANLIKILRKDPKNITDTLRRVSVEQSVQINTLRNYMRWPIAIMRDLGWTKKAHFSFQRGGKPFEVHKLTKVGRDIAERVSISADLRIDQTDGLPFYEKEALSVYAHYSMLERAGFDLEPVTEKLERQKSALGRALAQLGVDHDRPLLFSPFQSLSIADIQRIFPISKGAGTRPRETVQGGRVVGRGSRDHLIVAPKFVPRMSERRNDGSGFLKEELRARWKIYQSVEKTANAFARSRVSDKQDKFYPLVAQLFSLLGFESEYSRAGVNYQRWDACVWLDGVAVPIEIKSPTEEIFLSTKAIRQALENKVCLLARGGYETSRETTSLIVGYQIPNERGDMSLLIDDIFRAFKINIGVIDLYTLSLLAVRAVTESLTIQSNQLRTLRGFLHG